MSILSDELSADPLTRGYSAMTDQEVVDSLNTVDRTRNIGSLTSSQVANAIDLTEFAALSVEDTDEIWRWLSLGTLNPFGVEATRFSAIFGPGSATVSNLVAARTEDVSRAVEIGAGRVRVGTVQSARA